jgi:BRO family, N-terminal domain
MRSTSRSEPTHRSPQVGTTIRNSLSPASEAGRAEGRYRVRVVDRDGNPWFVLSDVCRVLAHSNPSAAAGRLDDDERMTLSISEGHSGQRGDAQFQTIINESGLYSLILTSRKDSAKRFKKWVTGTVLPSIRKHGGYVSGMSSGKSLWRVQAGDSGYSNARNDPPGKNVTSPARRIELQTASLISLGSRK